MCDHLNKCLRITEIKKHICEVVQIRIQSLLGFCLCAYAVGGHGEKHPRLWDCICDVWDGRFGAPLHRAK